jgi:hypothetical protein
MLHPSVYAAPANGDGEAVWVSLFKLVLDKLGRDDGFQSKAAQVRCWKDILKVICVSPLAG